MNTQIRNNKYVYMPLANIGVECAIYTEAINRQGRKEEKLKSL